MGDFIAALALIVSIISILFTALYSRAEENRQTRLQLTLALYNDFQAKEMLDSRIKADKLLRDNKEKAKSLTLSEMFQTLGADDWYHISRVVHFFEQLETYHAEGYLEAKLATALFSPYFNFFYREYLKQLLDVETQWLHLGLSLPKLKDVALWMN